MACAASAQMTGGAPCAAEQGVTAMACATGCGDASRWTSTSLVSTSGATFFPADLAVEAEDQGRGLAGLVVALGDLFEKMRDQQRNVLAAAPQ